MVTFSDKADVVVPPTGDHGDVVKALNLVQAEYGTAIGDAVARSLDLGIASLDKQKVNDGKVIRDANGQSPLVILLLSDGASTTGDYTPLEAAQLAKDANVPVYTVALGTANGTVQAPDGYGGIRTIRVRRTPRRSDKSRRRPAASSSPPPTPPRSRESTSRSARRSASSTRRVS